MDRRLVGGGGVAARFEDRTRRGYINECLVQDQPIKLSASP